MRGFFHMYIFIYEGISPKGSSFSKYVRRRDVQGHVTSLLTSVNGALWLDRGGDGIFFQVIKDKTSNCTWQQTALKCRFIAKRFVSPSSSWWSLAGRETRPLLFTLFSGNTCKLQLDSFFYFLNFSLILHKTVMETELKFLSSKKKSHICKITPSIHSSNYYWAEMHLLKNWTIWVSAWVPTAVSTEVRDAFRITVTATWKTVGSQTANYGPFRLTWLKAEALTGKAVVGVLITKLEADVEVHKLTSARSVLETDIRHVFSNKYSSVL